MDYSKRLRQEKRQELAAMVVVVLESTEGPQDEETETTVAS